MPVEAARVTIPVDTNAGQATAKFSTLNNTLGKTDKTIGKTRKTTGALSKSMKLLGGAVVIGGLVKGLKAVVGVTEQQQRAEAQLNAVIKSTGNVAGVTAEGLKDLASELQGVTTFGDEAIIGAQSLLLTFTKIGGEVLPDATEAVLNMSAALGQDLKQGSIQVGKALNDPIQGITALRRVGVQLTDSQENLIKNLVEVGDVAGAQRVILGELETQFGGAAAAAANTLGGSLKQLTNALGDAGEEVGEELTPGLKDLAQALKDSVQSDGIFIKGLRLVGRAVGGLAQILADFVRGLDVIGKKFSFDKQIKSSKKATEGFKLLNRTATQYLLKQGLVVNTTGDILKAVNKLNEEGTASQQRWAANYKKSLDRLDKDSQKSLNNSKDSLDGLLNSYGKYDKIISDTEGGINKLITSSGNLSNENETLKKSTEEYAASLNAARQILAESGDASAFLSNQRSSFAEQLEIVKQAGLDVSTLEKFQQQQRANQLADYLKQTADNENMSFEAREATLYDQYLSILSLENLSYQERLAAQEAFNQASDELERKRLQSFAEGVQFTAGVLGDFNSIAASLSEVRRNNTESEIQALKDAGATEEEIARKRAQLERKAAIDRKNQAAFAVLLDTSVAVTKTLATYGATPLGISLAALAAVKGAAEYSAIQSQPIPKAQFGGDYVVPPGNNADSGLLRVNSGEQVSVSPSRETGAPKTMIVKIGEREFNAMLVDETNKNLNNGSVQIRRRGAIKTA